MTPTYTYMNTYCIIYVYPETITRYYGALYCLRPVHKSTTINYTNRSGGGSPFRCRLLLCPLSPREAFALLSFYRIVIVYRFIVMVIELSKQFRYDIIVSLSNDIIESFDTISNTILYMYVRRTHKRRIIS